MVGYKRLSFRPTWLQMLVRAPAFFLFGMGFLVVTPREQGNLLVGTTVQKGATDIGRKGRNPMFESLPEQQCPSAS